MQIEENRRPNRRAAVLFRGMIALIGLTFMTSCNTPTAPDPAQLAQQTVTAEFAAAAATAAAITPEPTATAVPERHDLTFVTGGVQEALLEKLRAIFNESDFPFLIHETDAFSASSSLNDSDSLLFFPVAPEGLADIAAAHPSLKIAVLGKPAETGANVYSIRYDPTFETYLAGYAIGLTARDWRGGALLASDDPFLGERSAEIFRNGMRYFCGPCKAIVAPYTVYPLTITLPGAAAPSDWIGRLSEFSAGPINTLFVSDAAKSTELLTAANDLGYSVLTAGDKPADWNGNWLGGVRIDLETTLRTAFNDISAGTAANVIVPPLEILTGNQGGTFFEGKKYLIGQLYETMAAGMILTTDPVPQPAYAQ